MRNLQRAQEHYRALREQAETKRRLLQVAALNERVEQEQAADARARERWSDGTDP